MAWINPTVGLVDGLGYGWCLPCKSPTEAHHPVDLIDSGNCAALGIRCEGCGNNLHYDPTHREHQ